MATRKTIPLRTGGRPAARALPTACALTALTVIGLAAPAAQAQQLYSTDFDDSRILEYSLNGPTTPTVFASGGLLSAPQGLAFGPNGALDVTSEDPNTGAGEILQYSLANPAAAPTLLAEGDAFSVFSDLSYNNGSLYVSDSGEDAVLKLTASGLQTFASGSGLTEPTGLTFDSAGNLYVSSSDTNTGLGDVLEFNSGGTYQKTLVAPGAGGLNAAGELTFVGGSLYVANGQGAQSNGSLDRYSAAGQPQGTGGSATFASDASLINPYGLAVAANGDFFVGDQNSDTTLDPNNTNGGQIAEFAPNGQLIQYLINAGNPYGLAIGPAAAPEPSGPVALLVGAGLLAAFRARRRCASAR